MNSKNVTPSTTNLMTSTNLSPSSDPQPDPYGAIGLEILRELLRQARLTANVSIAAIAGSTIFGLVGGGLLLAGKATEATVTTTMGLFSSVYCTQAAKDSNEKLEKVAKELRVLRLPPEE
jgi:hypothetical protein